MKLLSFIFIVPFILFFSITEKDNFQFESTIPKKQSCRLEKVFINDTLLNEYHYNDKNQLLEIDIIRGGKVQSLYYLEYDKHNRISTSGYEIIKYHTDAFVEKHGGFDNAYVHQKSKYTYQYNEGNDTLISTMKTYSGYAFPENISEKDLNYTQRQQCIYNDKNQLVKLERIHKKKKKKSPKIKSWLEFEYNNNLLKVKDYFVNEYQDTILRTRLEREYNVNPNPQFIFFGILRYPRGIPNVNVVYEKSVRLGEKPKVLHEYKLSHEYDKNGVVIKTIEETLYARNIDQKGKINIYTYEYACE